MPNIRLAVRSSFGINAYRSLGSGVASLMFNAATIAPALVTPGGLIGVFGGGQVIDLSAAAGVRAMVFGAGGNVGPATGFSVLSRIIPKWTGNPAATQCIFTIGGFGANDLSAIIAYVTNAGNLELDYFNSTGNLVLSQDVAGFNFTAGTATDIMFSWDGTTGAGKMKLSQDGVLIAAIDVPANNGIADGKFHTEQMTAIYIGGDTNVASSNYYLNEFVIFDYAENPVYAARAAFWPTTPLDFSASTDPGAAHVQHDVAYNFQGTAKVGSYRGADLWSDPGASHVDTDTTYLADGEEVTGIRQDANPDDVLSGVVYGDGSLTGTLRLNTVSRCSLVVAEALSALPSANPKVTISQGDAVVLDLLAYGADLEPFSLMGATFETTILSTTGGVVTVPNEQHTPDPDQVTNKGKFTVALLTADSGAIAPTTTAAHEIVTTVTQGASVLRFRGKALLNTLPATPRT